MEATLVSFVFGFSVSGWVYHQISRRTGHNIRSSLFVAVFVGLVAAFVFYTLFKNLLN